MSIVEFGIRKPPVFLQIPYSTWEEGPKRKTAHLFRVTLTSVLRLYLSPEPAVVAKGQPCRLATACKNLSTGSSGSTSRGHFKNKVPCVERH